MSAQGGPHPVFLGQYQHSVDAKGRVAIPVRFRDVLKQGLVLAQGFDPCIVAYAIPQWQAMADQLAASPFSSPEIRARNRLVFSTAFFAELDGQGRVIIPPSLRTFAGIRDAVVVAGVHEYLEIWSRERWSSRDGQTAAPP